MKKRFGLKKHRVRENDLFQRPKLALFRKLEKDNNG